MNMQIPAYSGGVTAQPPHPQTGAPHPQVQHRVIPPGAPAYASQYPQRLAPAMTTQVPQSLPPLGRSQHSQTPLDAQYPVAQGKMGYNPEKPHLGSNTHGHTTPLMQPSYKMGKQPPTPQAMQMMMQQQQQQQQIMMQSQNVQGQSMSQNVQGQNMGQSVQNQSMAQSVQTPNQNQNVQNQAIGQSQNMSQPQGMSMASNEMSARIFKRNLGNAGVMRILDLVELVSSEPAERLHLLEFWARFVLSYFTPDATIRFTPAPSLKKSSGGLTDGFGRASHYELDVVTAPRFLVASSLAHAHTRHLVALPGIKLQVMDNGCVMILLRLHIHLVHADGSVGDVHGTVRISLSKDYRMDWLDCRFTTYQALVTVPALEAAWRMHRDDWLARVRELHALRCVLGVHDAAMRVMHIADLMTCLRPLVSFANANGLQLPMQALEGLQPVTGCQRSRNVKRIWEKTVRRTENLCVSCANGSL